MSEKEKFDRNDIAAPSDGSFSDGVELLSKALKSVFVVLAALIILALAWFLTCGGSFIVDSTTESVVVLKFGKFHKQYDSGWHWFLPYPINKIVRIPTIKKELRSISFLPANPARLRDPQAKVQGPPTNTLTPGADYYALLGDNSIMHSEWTMTYRVADPTQYFLNCMSRDTGVYQEAGIVDEEQVSLDAAALMLRSLLDDAVVTVSAVMNIQSTYYAHAEYENRVRGELVKNLELLEIGIKLESLSLTLVRPPERTLGAFEALYTASALAAREVEQARTEAFTVESNAKTTAARLLADAENYKTKVISETDADTKYFKAILEQYKKNPQATIVSLYSGKLTDALGELDEMFLFDASSDFHEVRILLNREPGARKTGVENNDEHKDDKR